MPILLDTGFIYALADLDDSWHARATAYLRKAREVLLAPAPVLPEVAYLLRERLGPAAEREFVLSLSAGEMEVESLTQADYRRCAALLERYPQVGFVDASVIAVAERLRLRAIATTDRRHFAMVRPAHVTTFELLP